MGISRGTTAGHLARAAVEAIAYQTRDLAEAMQRDARLPLAGLKVDGGASVNDRLMQFQADMLGVAVRRPVISETTALGAAYLAGLAVGFWQNPTELMTHWELGREFQPEMSSSQRDTLYARWQEAVRRSRRWDVPPEERKD